MALLQDGLVTVIAIAAAVALLRRVFASRRTSPGAAVQKPGCPGCASACDPPDPHSPSPASH